MSSAPVLLFALTFAADPGGSAPLEGFERTPAETGTVYHRGWTDAAVARFTAKLPRALARVEESLGLEYGVPFTTVLVPGLADLRRVVENAGGREVPDHVLGVAIPSRRLIVVRSDGNAAGRPSDAPSVTLVHEVAHLVIHGPESDGRRRVPKWLDEGLAMWVSQGGLTYQEEAELSLLARTDSLYRLQTLETAFPSRHDATSLAYRQSLLLVTFLEGEFGAESLRGLLLRVRQGEPFDRALAKTTGLDRSRLERRFRAWLARLHSLIGITLTYVDIWVLAGPLALLATLRHWRRRRRQWQELRRAEPDDDDGEGEEPEEVSGADSGATPP